MQQRKINSNLKVAKGMKSESSQEKKSGAIGTTPVHWFIRGLASGVMLIAACNALSYFFRTENIADLIGRDRHVIEAMGFPFEIWRENSVYHGSFYIDYPMAGFNLLIGLAVGTILGLVAVRLRHHFNRWVDEFEKKQAGRENTNFQFSVKSLLFMTTVAAIFIASLTNWKGTPEALLAIYFLGPLGLIFIAMMPKRIHWHFRIIILTFTAVAMITIAIWSGLILGVPVDRVMLGIFVSWTPQSAFAAFVLTVGLIAQLLWSKNEPETVGVL